MGISPPPGTPPAAPFGLRKYHCHRYLSWLSTKSNFAVVAQGTAPKSGRPLLLWLAGSSPRDNGKVFVEGYSIVNERKILSDFLNRFGEGFENALQLDDFLFPILFLPLPIKGIDAKGMA